MSELSLYPGHTSLNRANGPYVVPVPPDEYFDALDKKAKNGINNFENYNVYDSLAAFYEQNYVLISIVQTVLIFVLFIKLIKR